MKYNIILNFDLLDIINLQNHLKSDSSLKNKIEGLNYGSANRELEIVLFEELSESDISNVDNLISTYINEYQAIYKISNIGNQKMEFSSTDFTTIFTYNYKYDIDWKLDHVDVSTNTINQLETGYLLRVVNVEKNEVIALKTCDVTNDGIDTDNIPFYDNLEFNDLQNLEVQLKLTTPGVISLLSINFVYKKV
jgi:hypothetical protein